MFTSLLARLPPLPNAHGGAGSRVLILVSSIELALQTARVVAAAHPELLVELEQGARFRASGAADVTVATYQTLHRSPARLDKFDPAGFKGVIVDEAHHAAAPAYRSVLAHFDPAVAEGPPEGSAEGSAREGSAREGSARERHPAAARPVPIIGFSATFARHDGLALGTVFDRIVFHKDFLEVRCARRAERGDVG
jgi:ATP-dependent helicase IRC3